MRRSRSITLALALAGLALVVGKATATPPANVAGTFLARGTTSEQFSFDVPRTVSVTKTVKVKAKNGKMLTKTITTQRTVAKPLIACGPTSECDAVLQNLAFQPGASTGWHSHPGAMIVTVKSGALTRYEANCTKTTYSAGQAFVEMGPEHVVLVRNEGTDPAEAYVSYLVPAGTANPALRLDQSSPSGCPSIG